MVHLWEIAFVSCRLVIGILLLVSSVAKLLEVRNFQASLAAHRILPVRTLPAFAFSIPVVEFITGWLLLFNIASPVPELAAASLFVCFGLFIASSLLKGTRDVPCGCFGKRSRLISWKSVLQNLAFAGVAIVGLAHNS